MSFIITEFAKSREEEFMSHISDEVQALKKRPERISLEEYEVLRMNSYEREYLLDRYDDEALASMALHSVNNCTPIHWRGTGVASTYDEAVMHRYAPEMSRRLRVRSLWKRSWSLEEFLKRLIAVRKDVKDVMLNQTLHDLMIGKSLFDELIDDVEYALRCKIEDEVLSYRSDMTIDELKKSLLRYI